MTNLLNVLAAVTGSTLNPIGVEEGATDSGLQDNITSIINNVIMVLGIVAVVVIIIGGVGYMTSSGDTSKVKKAKDTILYGVIGLVVVALAFAITNFVIMNILGNQG